MPESTSTPAPLLRNPAKERLQAGDVALGISVRLTRSADIARIARETGHDFIFIDAQHSVFTIETISNMALTALACEVTPMVRVRSVDDPDVSLLLDNGVMGIVFPNVNSADEARRAVDASKFPPFGRRTVTGTYPHFGYRSVPLVTAVPLMNETSLVVVMIESLEGLANVEEIAAVAGVDVVLIGTNDMLFAMGKPGQFDDPEIIEAIDRTIGAAAASGKFSGCGGNRDVERQLAVIHKGVRFMTTQTDVGFLFSGATTWVKGLRDGFPSAKPA
jgi:2-keto-3-deoxy-L-rhamnonate aldolase RhmA